MRSLAVIALLCLALSSCTKTVTEVVEKPPIHDTLYSKGPALVRFISMVPDVSSINLWRNPRKLGSPFGSALSFATGQYYPVSDSTSLTLYCTFSINNTDHLDSITVPALTPFSLTTFALFYTGDAIDGHVDVVAANDSAKIQPAPKGTAYLRFLNGLQDYPAPEAKLYLNISHPGSSVFTTGGIPTPVFGGDMINYTPVAAGTQFFSLVSPTGEEVDSLYALLDSGSYYTARIQGKKSTGTARFRIDPE